MRGTCSRYDQYSTDILVMIKYIPDRLVARYYLLPRGRAVKEIAMQNAELKRLTAIEDRLTAIDGKLAELVPAPVVRASIDAASDHIAAMAEASELIAAVAEAVPIQTQQLEAITAWIEQRMTGEAMELEFSDLAFVSKQLIGILQGSRDDLLLLRTDVRRLAAVVEQYMRARAEDDRRWRVGDVERRRAG